VNVLVTGANGFVGSRLFNHLIGQADIQVEGAVRRLGSGAVDNLVAVGALSTETDWSRALVDKEVVIHTAARAHVMHDDGVDPVAEFWKVNVDGTVNLARQAANSGVRRFVFISSIKVNGEQTEPGKPFTADDRGAPEDAYGASKLEAERGLWAIGEQTGMEVVIIRPPLVYGPGVKGNFASMVNLIGKGMPLPLGAVNNRRSLLALDNLVDVIVTTMGHPHAGNQIFLAADGQDLSTTELLRGVGKAMGKPVRLIPVPAGMLMFGASMLGRKAFAQRLLGSLQVDISKTRKLLGWKPPLSVEEGLRRCFDSENGC
jgi:UDP-N-acetyl-alpha-D-quinovosamine dehydrogenase